MDVFLRGTGGNCWKETHTHVACRSLWDPWVPPGVCAPVKDWFPASGDFVLGFSGCSVIHPPSRVVTCLPNSSVSISVPVWGTVGLDCAGFQSCNLRPELVLVGLDCALVFGGCACPSCGAISRGGAIVGDSGHP